MSSARYHHHIACNVWHSAGAGTRGPDRAGLSWLAFEVADGTMAPLKRRLDERGIAYSPVATGIETSDPWGTRLHFVPA
jgi:catechol 2,3-dioxygenase